MIKKLVLLSFIIAAGAWCGTTGCGTQPCSNDPSVSCTNCGCSPCSDTSGYCWSCAGSDNHCYPYDCGSYCSASSCTSVTALANSVPKLDHSKNATAGRPTSAPAAVQKATAAYQKAAVVSKPAMVKISGTSNGCCSIVNNVCCPPGNSCEQSGMACSCDPSQCSVKA